MAPVLRVRLKGVLIGLFLLAGVGALAAGMVRGDGLLIMLGLLLAGIANVWRFWGSPTVSGPRRDQTTGVAMHLERTELPGVGTTLRFATAAGKWIGVIHHFDGRRELVVYALGDPDTVRASVPLTPDEAHKLADLLKHEPDAAGS